MKHDEFLSALDQPRIVAAIEQAERQTSGEIRVHVQGTVRGGDARAVAERTFERLGMTKTEQRNGVLLFIATEDRQFVILGDSGIDAKVPGGFWNDVIDRLTARFRSGEFTAGIVEAVDATAEHLVRFFPRAEGDVNELSDEIDTTEDE